MVENQRKEKNRGMRRDENRSSFSGLKQRLPPCWLLASADDHGGGSGHFSARDQEDDEGGRRTERGRRQSSPAVFHLALSALLPRPRSGF